MLPVTQPEKAKAAAFHRNGPQNHHLTCNGRHYSKKSFNSKPRFSSLEAAFAWVLQQPIPSPVHTLPLAVPVLPVCWALRPWLEV